MDKHLAREIRDLATEFLDIELQLINEFLSDGDRNSLEIRQEQIADEIKEIF